MKVSNHRLIMDDGEPVTFTRSPNQSRQIDPEYLVIHYTAGRSAAGSISWLTNPNAKASAHLVIGQDGEITQLVAFNRKAWHAGESRWAGRSGVNNFSIGIELDNPGHLKRQGDGWTNKWNDPVDAGNVVEAAHKNGGSVRGWHAYSGDQLEAVMNVAACLVNHYQLQGIVGHDDIAPNRKIDPGPAFPMESIRSSVMGRMEDAPEIMATSTALNVRSGPGVDFDKLSFSPLAQGTRLEIIGEQGVWRQVDVLDSIDGDTHRTGWVHGHYLARA